MTSKNLDEIDRSDTNAPSTNRRAATRLNRYANGPTFGSSPRSPRQGRTS